MYLTSTTAQLGALYNTLAQGLPDATQAVREVGLSTTLVLIIVIGVLTMAAASGAFIFKWLLTQLGKKDEQLLRVIEDRRVDLTTMQQTLGVTADAVRDG